MEALRKVEKETSPLRTSLDEKFSPEKNISLYAIQDSIVRNSIGDSALLVNGSGKKN